MMDPDREILMQDHRAEISGWDMARERIPDNGGERSGVRTQEDSLRRCGNYVGVIMGRQDDSLGHQTLSGRGGRAPDAVRTQRQAPDAVRTHRAKRSVPGWPQDSGWKQRQIRTQRRIDVAC